MKIFKINLIVFLLFSQVSANVHWHVDEHDNELEIRLSVHSDDIVEVHHPINHHDEPKDHHNHNDIHFETCDDYTRRPNSNISQSFTTNLLETVTTTFELNVSTFNFKDAALFRPPCFLRSEISDRAPPQYA